MKKLVTVFVAALLLTFNLNVSFAQSLPIEGLLDKAVSLAKQGGNQSELASVLGQSSSALTKEIASGGNADLIGKLTSQAGALQSLIPMVTGGGLNLGSLTKVASTVKLLTAANRISGILGGGKANLLTNAAALTSNLGLLKAGSSVLGGSSADVLGGLIDGATNSIGKFGNKGFLGIGGGKCAAGAASKQLGKIVSLVSGANF